MKKLTLVVLALALLESPAVVLENAKLAIEIDEVELAVRSVVNKTAGGVRFVEGNEGPGCWSATFRRVADGCEFTVDDTSSAQARRIERHDDGGAALVWEGIDLPDAPAALIVRSTISFTEEGDSRWSLNIENRSAAYGLWETRYPILRTVTLPGESDLLQPRPDTGAKLLKAYRGKSRKSFGCMAYFPMMTAFLKDGAGLYIAAHDSCSRIKQLEIEKDNTVSFVTPVENAGLPGLAAEGPRFEVTIAAIDGDWWQAAKLYRAWALTTPWTAKGRILDRTDYPRHIAEIPLWLNTHAYPDEVSNTMTRAKAIFPNHDVGLHWHLWQHSGHDVNYPEYFPEQPGTRECFDYCRSIGAEAMPYTNGRLWSTNLVSFPLVSHLAMTREDGKPYVEQYGKLTPPMSPMCPKTPEWDAVLNDFAERILELGAGSLFIDQVGACSGKPCYAAHHAHPIGGGTWYFDSYQALLEKTHARYAAKGAFLTTEGSAEAWMNVIDGYLQVTQRTTDDVPFFHAVYSGYTTYFCSPENHEDDLDSFWAAQARELMWGQSLGWYHPLILDDAEKCALVRRLTEFRQANLDCFAYGSLEGEVKFVDPVPSQPVKWLGRKQFFMWKVKDAPLSPTLSGSLPGVVGYIWRSGTTGERKLFLANLTAQAQVVRYEWGGEVHTIELASRELATKSEK